MDQICDFKNLGGEFDDYSANPDSNPQDPRPRGSDVRPNI